VARLRQEFLGKRVERRQAETLIEKTEAQDAIEAGRHAQQALDDWYRFGLHRESALRKQDQVEADTPVTASLGSNRSVRKS